VFSASALVYVVAAHNTNIETNFWTSYLTSQRGWSTATPTTGDMRFAQAQVLLKVRAVCLSITPLAVSKLLPPYTHVEIPGAAEGSDRVARGCSHHREERHLARVRAIGGDVPQRF